MAINWDAIRAEYVAGTESIRELSERHGVSVNAMEKRAAREGWAESRRKVAEKTAKVVDAKIVRRKADSLAKFNDQDLAIAQQLKVIAVAVLKGENKMAVGKLRTLAGIFESAQRMGRIALDANASDVEEEDLGEAPIQVVIERRDARVPGLDPDER